MSDVADEPELAYWRVAIVEDHLLQRRRTEEILGAQDGMRVVWSGETFPHLLAWIATTTPRTRPHLVVLDLVVERGPNVDPDQLRELVDSGVRVLVLSAMASPTLVRAVLQAGVGSFVGKRDHEEDLVEAAWAVLQRGTWVTRELASVIAGDGNRPALSDQEQRALVLYASGMTIQAVAAMLGVQPDTAKKYLTRVKAKYAESGRPTHSKLDLRREAIRDGLVEPEA
jgi:DNA-binding NarL/FixJ family response regulator